MHKHKTKILFLCTLAVIGAAIISLFSGGNRPAPQPGASSPSPITQYGTTKPEEGTSIDNPSPNGSQAGAHYYNSEDRQTFGHNAQPAESEKFVTIDNKLYPQRIYQTMAMPNDPLANQWAIANSKLPEAWDTPRGNHATILAVIDTGFALSHEEFENRWQLNSGEAGSTANQNPSALNCTDRGLPVNTNCNLIDDDGDTVVDNEQSASTTIQNPSQLNCTDQSKQITKDCNRVDDDNNGYIDDYRGWDFNSFDRSVQAGELNPSGSGVTHGTLVTGLAAATGNNSLGIAGVDWGTKILPIQALGDDGVGYTSSVGRAIYYAIGRGAHVISLSLGSSQPDAYVEQAVQAALQAGIVVVAAAGNDGCNCMVYPANYPEVIAVGALNSSSQRASFSSYGSNLDVLAPGTNITSASWSAGNQVSAYTSGVNGTSFATPIISGMLTRLLSHQPSAKPLQLVSAITENTNRLTLTADTPASTTLGYGALDAQKSTWRMVTPQNLEQAYAFGGVSTGGIYEPNGSYYAQQCPAGVLGGTAIYELTSSGRRFFTVSKLEMKKAQASGYSARLFSHSCLTMPHDRPKSLRLLNLNSEF